MLFTILTAKQKLELGSRCCMFDLSSNRSMEFLVRILLQIAAYFTICAGGGIDLGGCFTAVPSKILCCGLPLCRSCGFGGSSFISLILFELRCPDFFKSASSYLICWSYPSILLSWDFLCSIEFLISGRGVSISSITGFFDSAAIEGLIGACWGTSSVALRISLMSRLSNVGLFIVAFYRFLWSLRAFWLLLIELLSGASSLACWVEIGPSWPWEPGPCWLTMNCCWAIAAA